MTSGLRIQWLQIKQIDITIRAATVICTFKSISVSFRIFSDVQKCREKNEAGMFIHLCILKTIVLTSWVHFFHSVLKVQAVLKAARERWYGDTLFAVDVL